MATVTLKPDQYPVGASVAVYLVSNWPNEIPDTDAAPVGSVASGGAAQTMDGDGLSYTLAVGRYVAYAEVSGQHRYMGVAAGEDTPGGLVRIEEVDGLQAELDAKADETPEAWHEVGAGGEPAFQGGWTNLANFNTAAFRKDAFGKVHLKGVCIAAGTGFTLFTLPDGYKPATQNINIVNGGSGVATVARLTIEADGDVVSSTQTAGQSTVLDRVSFWPA